MEYVNICKQESVLFTVYGNNLYEISEFVENCVTSR